MKVKMVRDKCGTGERPDGRRYVTHQVLGPIRRLLLVQKMHEEVQEIAEAPTDPFEYADVLELLMELAASVDLSWDDVERARRSKRKERGGFEYGLVQVVEPELPRPEDQKSVKALADVLRPMAQEKYG